MNLQELFSKEIEIDGTFKCKERYIGYIIKFIKKEYGIETSKDELMIDIQSRLIPINPGTPSVGEIRKYFLTLEPTQSLLQKFKKDYPHFLI